MPLAAALQPLASLKQFVLCRVDPDPQPGAPWKTAKIPLSPTTMWAGSAQDPANWLDAATAFTLAERAGSRFIVGFVITANDPVWCVDIDNCLLPDNTWSPVAQQLCAYFPGAAVELSDSGHGLHIWGCGAAPAHAKKNIAHHVEFYTELRFIALGRQAQASGTVAIDWTAQLPGLVAAYFPPGSDERAEGADDEFDNGPVPEWRGPVDDNDLLRRAMKSQSSAAIFGSKASFADLWDCNLDVLARAFPSSTGDVFDRSSADQALSNHLSFWTGRDAQRMQRLMRESKLARPKWDDRGDYYLGRTINRSCRNGADVLTDKAPEERPGPVADPSTAPRPVPVTGETILGANEQMDVFGGYTIVMTPLGVLSPGGRVRPPKEFRAHLGGFTFIMDRDNKRTSRDAWEAITESQVFRAPKVDGLMFRPDLPFGAIEKKDGLEYANSYWPLDPPRKAGDATPFLVHMRKLFPDPRDFDIVLCYMAAIVQHPGVKFQWAPLIQGTPGNGKTTLSRCVAYAIGQRYVHWPKASKLSGKFNGWMPGKIFYAVEDIYSSTSSSDEVFEELKPMITGEYLEIEGKGVDQVTLNICGNFIFNTNHKGALRKTDDDRRIANFHTPQQKRADLARDGMTSAYFNRLRHWLEHEDGYAIVADLLHEHPIPDSLNPARDSNRAPDTTSSVDAVAYGKGRIEQEVLERVGQGAIGFAGGWVSDHYFELMLKEIGKFQALPPNRRRDLLISLGYDWHPALHEGRPNNAIMPDGKRTRLYVLEGSPASRLSSADAVRAYTEAQLEVSKT